MKISGKFLALALVQTTIWGTSTAFVVEGPNARTNMALALADGTPYLGGDGQSPPVPAAPLTPPPAKVVQSIQQGAVPGRQPLDRDSTGRRPGRLLTDMQTDLIVQGGSLRTWSFPTTESVQVVLQTEGRPLDADIELWQGPDNTPHKMRVYIEDGSMRPFNAVIDTPRGPNTIAVRNIGHLEFPLNAAVGDVADDGEAMTAAYDKPSTVIQGGALRTFPYESIVDSVQVLLKTDGRPLNARIELLQGPNNNKQVVELYTEDGMERPFYAIIATPGSGNVVRIVNTSPMEFPLNAVCEPYEIASTASGPDEGVMMGGM